MTYFHNTALSEHHAQIAKFQSHQNVNAKIRVRGNEITMELAGSSPLDN